MNGLHRLIKLQWSHHRRSFTIGIVVALIPAIAGIALLGVAGWFITAAALAGLSGVFLNVFLPSSLIRGLAIARTLGRYGERLLTHDATFRFLADLRCRVFDGQSNQAGGGSKPRSGAALNRLTSDISSLDAVYLRMVVPGALAVTLGALAVVWTVSFSPVLALGPIFLFSLIIGFGAFVLLPRKRNANGRNARRREAALDAVRLRTVDLVGGRRDLAVYGGLDAAAEAVKSAERRLALAEEESDARSSSLVAKAGFAGQVAVAITLAIVSWQVAEGALGAAVAVAVLLVVMGLPEVMGGVVPGLANIGRTGLAARRAVSGVQSGQEGGNSNPVNPDHDIVSTVANPAPAPALAFDAVTFGYPMAEREVLSDFTFEIASGEWLAIVGKSGCGKSTVSALVAGLLTPAAGEIRLRGEALSAIKEPDLRRRVTVLGQKPYLFHDSIAANLRIANPAASDDELWQALEMAALDERIRSNSSGLDAMLGETGVGLSGGEQRRLGLARAYLTQPDLFILDELTEGLDAANADEVLSRFERFRGEAAVLMIAHKPDEIARADRVLRLDAAAASMAVPLHQV
ncbi:thiol reductant ABC exporter subunit CydC [Roseibium algae]|uniref:Thiol reductant ABC exporter subunit CydC n=1 Tax=Roseibium algae TaxID=3123038 RepID=A0ABU8TIS4_9HYPH